MCLAQQKIKISHLTINILHGCAASLYYNPVSVKHNSLLLQDGLHCNSILRAEEKMNVEEIDSKECD